MRTSTAGVPGAIKRGATVGALGLSKRSLASGCSTAASVGADERLIALSVAQKDHALGARRQAWDARAVAVRVDWAARNGGSGGAGIAQGKGVRARLGSGVASELCVATTVDVVTVANLATVKRVSQCPSRKKGTRLSPGP